MSRLIESIVEVVTRYDRFYNDFRVIKLTVNQLASCIFGSGVVCLFDLFWGLFVLHVGVTVACFGP